MRCDGIVPRSELDFVVAFFVWIASGALHGLTGDFGLVEFGSVGFCGLFCGFHFV